MKHAFNVQYKYAILGCSKLELRIQQKNVNLGLFQTDTHTHTHNRKKSRAIRDRKSTQTAAPSQALWHFLTSSAALIIKAAQLALACPHTLKEKKNPIRHISDTETPNLSAITHHK